VDSLLLHLTQHVKDIQPDSESESPRRVAESLNLLIGSAMVGGEALEAVTRSLLGVKGRMESCQSQAIIRGVVCWVGLSDDLGRLNEGPLLLNTNTSCTILPGNTGHDVDGSEADSVRIVFAAIL
jgi:hypothetical protein